MMNIRTYKYTYLLVLISLILSGCVEEYQLDESHGKGTVCIKISAPIESKTPLSAEEDKMIKTLSVWMTNVSTGKIEHTSFTSPDATDAEVTFSDVERGDHRLYIVANYNVLNNSYTVGTDIDDAFLNTSLGPISDESCPSYTVDAGIPSSIVMDISVAPGTNTISAHLLRVVGRMSITFRNAVKDFDLYVGDIILAKRNVSKGFLFQKEDHSKPDDAVAHSFPALGGMVKIAAGSMTKLYDHYLFETSNDFIDPFTLSFSAGLYPAGTPESNITYSSSTIQIDALGTLGDITNGRSDVNDLYFIKHSSGNRYMCVENGSLVLKEVSSNAELNTLEGDDLKKYLWRLSSTGNTARIIHYLTEKEITYTTDGAASLAESEGGRQLTVGTGTNNGIRFSYRQSRTYYLAPNSSNSGMIGSTSTSYWNLRKATISKKDVTYKSFLGAEKDVPTDHIHTIKYIDKYGLPVPLQHICRNEHVDIVVNIQYNSEVGQFDFAVEPWSKIKNETTFD